MRERVRLLAVVPSVYDTSPGQRFRIEQWEPYLTEAGIDVDYQPFEDDELHALVHRPGAPVAKLRTVGRGFVRRVGLVRRRSDYDAVYVFREAALAGPPVFERWLARSGPPVIFDFDDAIYLPYKSTANGYLSLLKFPWMTGSVCRVARHVTVGSEILADYARQFTPAVTVLPTTVDTLRHTVERRPPSEPPVIGWTGSHSTLQHLDTLAPALRKLASTHTFRLRVVGPREYRMDGIDVDARVWSQATEVSDLRGVDVGVMPLPDEPWTRGKCGLKAIQFMALGLPVVCSPVGVNPIIVEDGRTGLLASSDDEWVDALVTLLESPELRRRLGDEGRRAVETRYAADVQGPRFAELVLQLAGRG